MNLSYLLFFCFVYVVIRKTLEIRYSRQTDRCNTTSQISITMATVNFLNTSTWEVLGIRQQVIPFWNGNVILFPT